MNILFPIFIIFTITGLFLLGKPVWERNYIEPEQVPRETNLIYQSIAYPPELPYVQELAAAQTLALLPFNTHGLIIPHDTLPINLTERVLATIAQENPQTIILLVPNHANLGNASFISSTLAWRGRAADLLPDVAVINGLVENGMVTLNDDAVIQEHGVRNMLPSIEKKLPRVRIVPLLVSNFARITEIQTAANVLSGLMNEDTIIIAAVDFAHDVNQELSEMHDQATLQAIEAFDYHTLYSYSNDHLDGPAAIVFLLETVKHLGATNQTVLSHTNSNQLLADPYIVGTSYFFTSFH